MKQSANATLINNASYISSPDIVCIFLVICRVISGQKRRKKNKKN